MSTKKPNICKHTREIFLDIFLVSLIAFFTCVPQYLTKKLRSANLTVVSVTMSTSKLSYKAQLSTGNTAGSSIVTINGSGPSTTTTNLFTGDTVWIGTGATGHTYTVNDILSSTQFELTSGLNAADLGVGNPVIASRSSTLSVRFTTASAVANGAFRILVPTAPASYANNGIPEQSGFDFGGAGVTPTVTCPASVGATYNFVAGTATPSATTINGINYHAFTCRYSGTGAVGQAFETANNIATISALINPAPNNTHAAGTADQYQVIVQQLSGSSSGDSLIDQTTVALAPIEAVRVTATVTPVMQFSIAGVASGATNCGAGATTTVDTTATGGNVLPNVPLGSLSIGAFTDAEQKLTVSTNAINGYTVTAQENDQLTKPGSNPCHDLGTDGYGIGHGCIADVSTGYSETGTGLAWSSTSNKGFGYTVAVAAGMSAPAYYSAGTSSCGGTGTFCARKFPDSESGEAPQTVFYTTLPRDTDIAYVCYRAIIATSQEAGNYQNNVIYTATGTF